MQRHTDFEKETQTYLRYKAIFLNFLMEVRAFHRTLKKGKLISFSLLLQL